MQIYLIILRLILWSANDTNEVENDLLYGLVASDYGYKGGGEMMMMEIQLLSTQI